MLTLLHLGCGAMAGLWLKSAASLPEVRIVGLADLREDAAAARRDEFAPDATIGTDAVALMAALRPDLVFNCTVPEAHHATTAAALRAGAHVLSEKPLAANLAEARDLVRLAAAGGRTFAVMQNRRHTRAIRHVQALLQSGVVGELTEVHCDFLLGAHFTGFRLEMEHVLLLDMAIHHFDMARFLTSADARRVACHEWTPAGSWFRHGACAHAHFQLSTGTVFSYRGSWVSEGHCTTWGGRWRFTGTRGTLIWDGDEEGGPGSIQLETVASTPGLLSTFTRTEGLAPPAPGRDAGHASLIADFVSCICECRTPETTGADNLRSLAMVEAAIQSAEAGGQPVEVPSA
jgi:predicted dehydrogenase